MIDVTQAVTEWVRGVLGGVPTSFGELPDAAGESAMVKASPSEPVVRRYRSGGGEFRFAYEVYLRCQPRTEGQRIDGAATLMRVSAAATAHGFPDVAGALWNRHTVTQQPSAFRTESNGAVTYMMAAYVTWIERS